LAGFLHQIPGGTPWVFFGGVPKNGVRGRAPLSGVPEETPGGGAGGKNIFSNKNIFIKKTQFRLFFIDRV